MPMKVPCMLGTFAFLIRSYQDDRTSGFQATLVEPLDPLNVHRGTRRGVDTSYIAIYTIHEVYKRETCAYADAAHIYGNVRSTQYTLKFVQYFFTYIFTKHRHIDVKANINYTKTNQNELFLNLNM